MKLAQFADNVRTRNFFPSIDCKSSIKYKYTCRSFLVIGPPSALLAAAARFRKNGALAPLLILNAVITLPCLIIGYWAAEIYQYFLMLISGIILTVTLISYIGFALFAPDRLHSENYQIAAQGLGLLGDERISPRIVEAVIRNVPAIMNPQLPRAVLEDEGA